MNAHRNFPVAYEPTRPQETPAFAGDHKGGENARHTIFSPQSQAKFLSHLSLNGNVRLACRAARVSPQTAYRARRAHTAFARAWDAALLSARDHAEQVLADRALNGVEEAVFYHGEEVARRVRYSDRLLLAHLARLDRLAERAEVSAALSQLDDTIEALERGEELIERVPAQAGTSCNLRGAPAVAGAQEGQTVAHENAAQDTVPCVPSCRDSAPENPAVEAGVEAGEPPLERRLRAMEAARPADAPPLSQSGDPGEVELLQLLAFEAGLDEWWLMTAGEEREQR